MLILSVKHLSKIYEGKVAFQALNNIHFNVAKGGVRRYYGSIRRGKTTLLNLIATIDQPTAEEVIINGRNPHLLSRSDTALFRRRSWASSSSTSTCWIRSPLRKISFYR